MTRVRQLAPALLGAALLAALAAPGSPAAAAPLPDLCALTLAAQLRALRLAPACSVTPSSPLAAGARERQVTWGTQGNYNGLSAYRGLGIVVYTGLSAQAFAQDYALGSGTGSPVAIGEGGREETGPHMLELSTFAGGVGIEAVFQVKPGNASAEAAALRAFVKAFVAHI